MLRDLVSKNGGRPSSMRAALLLVVLVGVIFMLVMMFCLVYVVLHKQEFPSDFWKAMAGLGGFTGTAFAGKATQEYFERKYPEKEDK